MSKKFSFDVWLEGTPEQQAAESERQALALASHSRAKMTEAERLIGRGKLLEETARLNLEAARGKDAEARVLAENNLADALAMQGRYAEAAETHHDNDRRAWFRQVGAAIELPDDDKCACPDNEAGGTPRFERDRIFSPVHGETVSLVECQSCGHLNARPLRSRLLKHRAAMASNEAQRRPVITDAQLAQ